MGVLNWIRVQWDRAAALVALLAGVLALLMGWLGVSGKAYVAEELPYIVSGALFGMVLIGVGVALWLSADLRDEWRELRAIRQLLKAAQSEQIISTGAPSQSAEHTVVLPTYRDTTSTPTVL